MSEVTVKQFAEVVGIPVDRLLTQLGNAGISVGGADDTISDDEKMELLAYLRKSHGKLGKQEESGPKKITLKRKTHSELKVPSAQGRTATTKTVTVEVRKKRTYVKRSDILEEEEKRLQAEAEERARQEAEEAAARKAEEERKAKEEAERQAREEAERKQAEETAAREAEAQRIVEEQARQQAAEAKPGAAPEADKGKGKKQPKHKRHAEPAADEDRKQSRKYGREELHVSADKSGKRRKKSRQRSVSLSSSDRHGFEKPTAPIVREVGIPESITVAELAQKMSVKAA
ncbi:MAG TPA: translation initiation factor IF-2 associated domain-containing protein, partial [Thiohalobacter sp.]|nr:translation initiation factor IF-2 associated domain-containing protein [Thiohalobacter sp.]